MLKSCCCCCCFMLHNVRPPNINALCCLPSSRYEGRIVQQMIRSDGGKGDYTEVTPPMLGIWETVLAVGSCPLLICCILSPVMQIINCCKLPLGHANIYLLLLVLSHASAQHSTTNARCVSRRTADIGHSHSKSCFMPGPPESACTCLFDTLKRSPLGANQTSTRRLW